MRHLILVLISISVLSCGVSKTVINAKKTIKGNWTLDKVTYDKTGTFDIILLKDGKKECFEGSSWQFIPNNNSGIYQKSGSNCDSSNRNFIFTIKEINAATGVYDFLLKPTNSKHKSITNEGFRLRLSQLTATSMTWKETVEVEGKPFIINMVFTKQ